MGSHPSPLRIAVLECDTPNDRIKSKYTSYGAMFETLLRAGAAQYAERKDTSHTVQPELDILRYDVVNSEVYPDLKDVDALLLTGSKYNAFDNDPWILKLVEYTRTVLAQDRVRLIGVCFGHQIIGRALDVKVDRSDRGWEIAVLPMTLTAKGKELFGVEEVALHQMHRDVVYEYPKGIEPLGHSPRCDVQGMYAKNRLITVQGHPEFNGEIVEALLEDRHDRGIFDDALYEDGMKRVQKQHDGVLVSTAFIKFLVDD